MREKAMFWLLILPLVTLCGALVGTQLNDPASATELVVTCSDLEGINGEKCVGEPTCPTIIASDGCNARCGGSGGGMSCDTVKID